MKATIKALLVLSLFAFTFNSCKEEDEKGELKIEFQKGNNYVSTDSTITGGTDVLIGIEAETEKAKDPIIKFNITKFIDGATTGTEVYTETLEDVHYEYGYSFTLDSVPAQKQKYTFKIFNRDGIDKDISLTITVK